VDYPNTTKGDNWTFSARVTDGYNWSDWYNSSGFIIGNTPGTAINILITSDNSDNRTYGNLTGGFNFYDPDSGDSMSDNETMWFLDDVEDADFKNFTWIDYQNTSRDETWIISIRVHDGNEWGIWLNSSGFVIQNTPPTSPDTLTPNSGTWGGNTQEIPLSCSGSSDVDGDDINYTLHSNRTSSWTEIVALDDDGSYNWNISSYSTQYGVALRCLATDSDDNSAWYPGATGGGDLGIDNDGPFWSNPQRNFFLYYIHGKQ